MANNINMDMEEFARQLLAATQGLRELSEEEQAELERKKAKEAKDKDFEEAAKKATQSLKSFGTQILTAGGGMDKYTGAVQGMGDAAWQAGKHFGAAGMAIGGFIKIITSVTGAVFKQNDAILKAADSLAQVGVTGGITTKEILKLGQKAGYASGELDQWVNITKSLGTDLLALGASATKGTKAFGELTVMDTKLLEGYRNLGVSQEDLNKNQAEYIKLQIMAGMQITERSKQDGSLRKASLEYTNNLLELSAITGESVDNIKKQQEANRANLGIQIELASKQDQILQLEKKYEQTHNEEYKVRADNLKREVQRTKDLQDVAAAMGMSGKQMAGFNQMLSTGTFTQLSKGFAAGAPGILEFLKAVKEGKRAPAELINFMVENNKRVRQNTGEAMKYSEETAEALNVNSKTMQLEARFRGISNEERMKIIAEEKAAREKQLKGDIEDDAKRARNAQETAERNSRLVKDQLVDLISGPVTTAFEKLMKAISWAAKGIAKFAGWILRDDSIMKMFETPEDIVKSMEDNQKALSANASEIKKLTERRDYTASKQEKMQLSSRINKLEKERVEMLQKEAQLAKEKIAKENEMGRTSTTAAPTTTSEVGRSIKPSTAGGGRGTGGADFYNQMYSTLYDEAKKAGVKNPEVVAKLGAAQASLETGYGRSTAGGNNYFGIKAKPGDGTASMVNTQEYNPATGKMETIKAGFRKYGSMKESAADYIKFLQTNQRYKGVLGAQSLDEAITAQSQTGYATDPQYGNKLRTIAARSAGQVTAQITPEQQAAATKTANQPEQTESTAHAASTLRKLDALVAATENSNHTLQQILKYSKA